MRKFLRAIFFLTPGILMRFLAKKCENIAKSRQKMIPAVMQIVFVCVCRGGGWGEQEVRILFLCRLLRFGEQGNGLGLAANKHCLLTLLV